MPGLSPPRSRAVTAPKRSWRRCFTWARVRPKANRLRLAGPEGRRRLGRPTPGGKVLPGRNGVAKGTPCGPLLGQYRCARSRVASDIRPPGRQRRPHIQSPELNRVLDPVVDCHLTPPAKLANLPATSRTRQLAREKRGVCQFTSRKTKAQSTPYSNGERWGAVCGRRRHFWLLCDSAVRSSKQGRVHG